MVIPDRDIPGTMAIAWEMPATRDLEKVTVSKGNWPVGEHCPGLPAATFAARVDRYRIQPVMIRPVEATVTDEKDISILSSNNKPITPAGTEAAAR